MKSRYTKEQLDYLRIHNSWDYTILAWALNLEFGLDKTAGQIKAAYSNHKIKRGFRKRPALLLSKSQIWFLKKNYTTLTRAELTVALNKEFDTSFTEKQITYFTRNHKLKSGRTGCFVKGSKPWNTGTKGVCRPNSGSFKNGQVPPNRRPLGSERICPKDGYILIKIAEENPYTGFNTRWKAKHIVIWEARHGAVPDGHIVRFKDNNKLNCTDENLELVSRQEHLYMNRHGYNELADELKPSFKALAKVVVKAGSLQK